MKKKVFVINKSAHDYSDAERFGEIHFLSEGPFNRFATTKIYREFIQHLQNSHPSDYIIPTGLSIMSLIACSIFAHKHGRLNLLLWKSDNEEGTNRYVDRTLVFDQKERP